MKLNNPSFLLVCLLLAACGKAKDTKQKDPSGRTVATITSSAGVTVGNCAAMNVKSVADLSQIQDQQDLSGFTACATSDANRVRLIYNNYMYNQYAGTLQFSAISGDNQQVANFSMSSGSGSVDVIFPDGASSVYVIMQKDEPSFGEGSTAMYTWAQFR